jgi:hypothetical protein
VRARVAARAAAWPRCTVLHCPKPPTGATTSGLNRYYCKAHEDHFERHGSYSKRSYTAAEINPYRRSAFIWLEANSERPAVKAAVAAVRALYPRGGRHEEAFHLRGMSPTERAAAAWARLRKAGVDPRLPLAALLAVAMIELDETQPEFRREFRRVQVAKIVHRLASGSHKRWTRDLGAGRVDVTEFHKYPQSRGRVLRVIGEQLEDTAGLILNHHLDGVHKFAKERMANPRGTARPHSRTAKTRRRHREGAGEVG